MQRGDEENSAGHTRFVRGYLGLRPTQQTTDSLNNALLSTFIFKESLAKLMPDSCMLPENRFDLGHTSV